jgi:Helicase associated domain
VVLAPAGESELALPEDLHRHGQDRSSIKALMGSWLIACKPPSFMLRVTRAVTERHIGTVILDSLGVPWDERYGQLASFKAREGHCNVPVKYLENPRLGTWLAVQRALKRRGRLSSERETRLAELGLAWEPFDAFWEDCFKALVAFQARHGHCSVPRSYPENPQLSTWVNTQRTLNKRSRLSPDRVERLTKLGFVFKAHEEAWEEMFETLAKFKARCGHCDVPAAYPKNPQLGSWLDAQRQARRRGTLTQSRTERLTALGVAWDLVSAFWEQRFQELMTFKAREGHCHVSSAYPENPPLGIWLNNQRSQQKKGRLSHDYLDRLTALGVDWTPNEGAWERRFRELELFKAREGHGNIPQDYPENPQLGSWLSNQRQFKRRGTLSQDRINRLEGLGVVWDTLDTAWEKRFRELAAFKAREGHCNVPQSYPDNPQLGRWLSKQRGLKGEGTLLPDRIDRLERLGVIWDPLDVSWEERFQDLIAFNAREGHSNVPMGYSPNPQLAVWLGRQRRDKKRGKLTQDRVARLKALGVTWEPRDTSWEKRFRSLAAFKRRFGHCRLPQDKPEDLELARWLSKQRQRKAQGTLLQERIERLEALGIVWEPYDATWEQRFQELAALMARYEHRNVLPVYSENPQLATWLESQRGAKKTGRLSPERMRRLESIGVVRTPLDAKWERRFLELTAFKKREGHCNVPAQYPKNPQLGKWLSVQRDLKRSGTLSTNRAARLKALAGANWARGRCS